MFRGSQSKDTLFSGLVNSGIKTFLEQETIKILILGNKQLFHRTSEWVPAGKATIFSQIPNFCDTRHLALF